MELADGIPTVTSKSLSQEDCLERRLSRKNVCL